MLPSCGTRRGPAPDLAVSPAALRAHVDALCAIHYRRHADAAGMKQARDYVLSQFKSAGLAVETQHYAFGRGSGESENVIGTINGDRPEILVIGAHYDVAGDIAGADDNASGVAGLIELARLLQANRARIPSQVQLVAYANEEPPWFRTPGMGSFQHAWKLYGEHRRVLLMISLEMIGYFSDTSASQTYPSRLVGLFRPTTGNFISLVSSVSKGPLLYRIHRAITRTTGLPVETLNAPHWVKGVDYSDHLNYWRFGFPAMMVTDTAFFRNPNYHAATDTPETLDYDRMAKVVSGLAAWVLGV